MRTRNGCPRFVWLLCCCLLGGPAWGQADESDTSTIIDEIIVSAQKREQTVQDVSSAVEVISGVEIQEEGRTKLDEVLANATSVVVQGQARGFTASIRGLGLSLPPGVGQAAVSNYYDGIFSERAESASAGFYDIDRIEVLRGPQSTLYGRNSVGGLFNVLSRDPDTQEVSGYAQLEAGNYSNVRGEGAVNFPLSDVVALRVSGAVVDRDGYISNGQDDNEAWSARAKLLVEPNDSVRTVIAAEFTHLDGAGPGAIPLVNVGVNRDTPDPDIAFQDYDTVRLWVDFEARIGAGLLTVQPSYQKLEGELLGAFGGNFTNIFDPRENTQKAFEARYQSLPDANIDWSVGYYYYDSSNERLGISGTCADATGVFTPGPGFSQTPSALGGPPAPPGSPCLPAPVAVTYTPDIYETNSQGLFAQATFPVSDRVRLTAGLRYNEEEYQGSFNPFDGTVLPELVVQRPLTKEDNVDFKAGVEFDASSDTLLYGNIASGYRTGGYNVFDPALSNYSPEDVIVYEFGTKNSLLDGRWLLNANAFYYDYKNYQLVFGDGLPPPIGFIAITDLPAEMVGIEIESAYAVGDHGRLTTSVVYLDSEIDSSGIAFPNSPDLQVKASYSHEFNLGRGVLVPKLDVRHLSSQFVFPVIENDPPPVVDERTQGRYTVGDLFVSYRPDEGDWGMTAYVKNISDEAIKTSAFFGFGQLAPPRTYGITLRKEF